MGKLSVGRVLNCLSVHSGTSDCFCINSMEGQAELERSQLVSSDASQQKLRDLVEGNQTMAFQLKPKTVELRVSMHCNGCARKIKKHISKMEGVSSCKVDLESKRVVVIGDIDPLEVLKSLSKVKIAELWTPRS